MKLLFVGILIGALGAIHPKIALWVCGVAAVLGALGLMGFLILIGWVIACPPRKGGQF